jgi:hypothetical protein
MVASDSGLYTVYAGYVLLVAGIAWHFWVRRALQQAKGRRPAATDVPQPIEPHPEERQVHGS